MTQGRGTEEAVDDRRRRGRWTPKTAQSSTETMLMITLVVFALAFMSFYVQRGIQGGLQGATSALGMQFDPRDLWGETEGTNMVETVTEQAQPHLAALGAYLLDGRLPDKVKSLPDLPTSSIHREPSLMKGNMGANWQTQTNTTYCDARVGGGCP